MPGHESEMHVMSQIVSHNNKLRLSDEIVFTLYVILNNLVWFNLSEAKQ
jgi:hypothetical protein